MTAYIGYKNLFESAASVSVTSQATGFEKENAYDWLTFDWWKAAAAGTVYITLDMGSAVSADYWALASHDLPSNSGTIKPQYSSDNFAADINDFDIVQTPSDESPIFRKVTSRSARYWRFEISSTGAASAIGQLCIGEVLTLPYGMPKGFTPPTFNRDNKILNSVSAGGAFLGRSIERLGNEVLISQRNVSPAWMRSNYLALADHFETKPFFFSWDYENYPGEAAFCWVKDKQTPPKYSHELYMDFSISCEALA